MTSLVPSFGSNADSARPELWRTGNRRTVGILALGSAAFVLLVGAGLSQVTGAQSHDTEASRMSEFAAVGAGPMTPALLTGDAGLAGNLALTRPVAALPFSYSGSENNREKAVECLAYAAWYEAGNDPVGQRAVMQTVINRVNHPAYPNSVCGVIFEGSHLSTGCQFTFTCDGSVAKRRPGPAALAGAKKRAEEALEGKVDDAIGNATHYHADYVYPYWASNLDRVAIVGPHIFYRFRSSRSPLRPRAQLDGETGFTELAARIPRNGKTPDAADGVAADGLAQAELDLVAPRVAEPVRTGPANAFYIAVGDARAAGRWAITALEKCQGKPDCQVVGYENEMVATRNRGSSPADRQRPLFVFVRDKTSRMEIALWDCQRVSRGSAAQCLPEGSAALGKLLRDRS